MSSFPLFFQPTFTQGLIVGQLSILFLLGAILKYLFFESGLPEGAEDVSADQDNEDEKQRENDAFLRQRRRIRARKESLLKKEEALEQLVEEAADGVESTEWFNVLLKQIVDVYRSKLRDDAESFEGDEIARSRIETFVNSVRPAGFLDYITIHSVDLGRSAPTLYNARVRKRQGDASLSVCLPEFDASYTDTISISLSTSYLFNYPMVSFARLPISLTISLSQFKSALTIQTPPPSSSPPVVTLTISPNFILDLTTTSLMGSRAKLANVPKLHELIQHQVRRILAARATWKVVLPGLSSVAEVKKELKESQKER
ncbi:hypothetical protein CPB83DRAFT_865990 [Crepidotus variabilis]|uniref:Maintenance of mitochondrial morphology protein 1 n=1 Tax=Crepidotus variabilis TaxID=179855 RepID=A0A9P6EVW1_9AGAR|nr:hypothetical protein CPB83DRAFT_865990 [Crepidotus variabilis]